MELTNTQYQRLCNVANAPHDDPSINELISAFQMQRLNLVACENVVAELRAENAALTDKFARMTNEVLKMKAHLSDGGAYTISRADNGNMFIGEDLMWSEIFNNLDALLPAPDSQQQE